MNVPEGLENEHKLLLRSVNLICQNKSLKPTVKIVLINLGAMLYFKVRLENCSSLIFLFLFWV